MFTDAELRFAEPRQFGFFATAPVVRAFVPASSEGVYMLLKDAQPFYDGRSDHCVHTRLCTHELLPQASHFTWEPCAGPVKGLPAGIGLLPRAGLVVEFDESHPSGASARMGKSLSHLRHWGRVGFCASSAQVNQQ